MSAPARICQRGFGQQLQAGIVEHILPLDHAAMPMTGVFAKADIGDDGHARHGFFKALTARGMIPSSA